MTGRKHIKHRRTRASFPNEKVENADLDTPVLKKIMTTND